jgi:hypothetical protein
MLSEKIHDDRLLRSYLLGLLPEEETERLDELSISDDEFSWLLKAAENEMIDAFVRDELSGDMLDRFQSVYLTLPAKNEKVEFARALLSISRNNASSPRPNWFSAPLSMPRWALACGLAAAIVITGFLLYNQYQLQTEQGRILASYSDLQSRERELRSQIERMSGRVPSSPAPEGLTLAVLLPPPTRGSTRPPVVSIPPATSQLAIQLQLEANDSDQYRVLVKDAATSQVIWRSSDLVAQAHNGRASVSILVPARVFKSRRYLLELSSGASHSDLVGNYVFDVTGM